MHSGQDLLGTAGSILDAAIHDNMVLYTTNVGVETHLQFVTQNADKAVTSGNHQLFRELGIFSSSITSVAIVTIKSLPWALVAGWNGSSVELLVRPVSDTSNWHEIRLPTPPDTSIKLEAISSIAVINEHSDTITLLCGTRNGFVITLQIDRDDLEIKYTRWDRFGANKVSISKDANISSAEMVLVTCDSKLYYMIDHVHYGYGSKRRLQRNWRIDPIWVTNVLDPALPQPNIDAVSNLPPDFLNGSTDRPLLLVTGSQLLLANLSGKPTAVPRHIPIRGTPSRILYSHTLGALIVGASIDRRSTLLFIDPDTGVDISRPVDKKGDPVDFVSGLGNINERIFGLLEWPYTKDGRTWHFLIVCTSSGRLLIISFDKEASSVARNSEADEGRQEKSAKIRYWTRYKYKTEEPIYSVTGYPSGLCYCSGTRLYFETLDLTERKFKKVSDFRLPSLARVLSHEDSNIYALTSNDSLHILKLVIPDVLEEENYQTIHTHSDKETRSGLDHKLVGVGQPINLISDRDCSLSGQWASQNTKSDTLINVFEAALPYSVLKFHITKTRPIWDPSWNLAPVPLTRPEEQKDPPEDGTASTRFKQLDIIPSTRMHGEILGLSIDGSLSQFTLLGVRAWRFLRYLYNLAVRSPDVGEFVHGVLQFPLEPTKEPKLMMHVDGDMLRHCLEGKKLERLVCMSRGDAAGVEIFNTFCELLRELHEGTLDEQASAQDYVDLAYDDLEFYLRPVL